MFGLRGITLKKIAVIGVGSAGILCISHLLTYLTRDYQVVSIHNPMIDIVGIGESTNPKFVESLVKSCNFNVLLDLQDLDGTHKFGTMFKKWREHDIMNPLIGGTCAIHFNTHKLKEFILPKLQEMHGDKFKQVAGNVTRVESFNNYAEVEVDGVIEKYDYVIDCRGFPKDYTDYNICDLPVNRCAVHNIMTPGDWKYTGHRAHKNGWMFEIPLSSRKSYGYLYNDSITTKEEALEDFSQEIGVPVENLDNIEYKFQSYYANKIFDGRVMKNGNSAIFFEPMAANSLWIYGKLIALFMDYVYGNMSVEQINYNFTDAAKQVEEIICYFYHGGSNYDTKFWRITKELTNKKLQAGKNLQRCIDGFKFNNHIGVYSVEEPSFTFSATNLRTIDKEFGYNYFG